MKILRLKFCNLNSLQGEHEICFDRDPIASAGLFTIVGPTGAGKSTILDAITLALYSHIPRFGKVTQDTILSLGSIVTHHMTFAYAELEYQTKNGRYVSVWRISKNKRNDNWGDYQMEIYDKEKDQLIADKKSEVPAKNAELIGLTYEQFIKSILLSQGEFAQFIKSNADDRSKLLEKLTGSEIYRQIGKLAFEQNKKVRTEVTAIEERLAALSLLGEEDVKSMSEEILKLKQESKAHSIEMEVKQSLKHKLERIQAIRHSIAETNQQVENLKLRQDEFKPRDEALQKHEMLGKHRDDLALYENKVKEIASTKEELSIQIGDHAKIVLAMRDVCKELSTIVHSEVDSTNFLLLLQDVDEKYSSFTAEMEGIKKSGLQLKTEIQDLKSKLTKDILLELDAIKSGEEIDRIEQLILGLHRNIEVAVFYQMPMDQLLSQSKAYRDEMQDIDKALELGLRIEKIEMDTKQLNTDLLSISVLIEKTKAELKALEKDIAVIQKDIEEKKLENEHRKAQFTLKDYRAQLVEGEPCPLCGSRHHALEHEDLADIGLLGVQIMELENKLKAATNKNLELHGHSAKALQSMDNKTDQLKQWLDELSTLQSKFHHDYGHQYDDTSTTALKQKKAETEKACSIVEEALKGKQNEDILQSLKIKQSQRKGLLLHLEDISLKRNLIYAKDDFKPFTKLLQQKYTKGEKKETSTSATMKALKAQVAKSESILKDTLNTVLPSLKNMGFESMEAALSHLLSDQVLNVYKAELIALDREHVAFQTQTKTLNADLLALLETIDKEAMVDLTSLTHEIETLREMQKSTLQNLGEYTEKLRNHNANLDAQGSLQAELEIKKKEQVKYALLNTYIGDAEGKSFSKFAQELTMKKIVYLANIRLEKLSDRYAIYVEKIEDIMVIDRYQGDALRDIKTLSGGETFLLSLALALSLSDLASNEIQIESMFIDEGFGTLDEESLDQALTTLESLQYESQKTIGIISHVESMKERITTQIRVKKGSNGLSTIEVVG